MSKFSPDQIWKAIVDHFKGNPPPSDTGGDNVTPASTRMANAGFVKTGENSWAEPTPTPTPTPIPEEPSPVPEDFRKIVDLLVEKYQIPKAVTYGQWAQEGRGQGEFGQPPYNNPMSIGAFDSDPHKAKKYDDVSAGMEAYMKLISEKYKSAYDLRYDAPKMIDKIQELNYASNPNYANDVKNTPEWKYYIKRP